MTAALRAPVEASPTLDGAVRHADIVLTATWARAPFLFAPMLRPGMHVTTLGADEPGKCEVDAGLIREAVLVCDDRELAVHMGAVGAAGLGHDAIDAELGEVLAGTHPGRTSRRISPSTAASGSRSRILSSPGELYRHATARQVGRTVDFLA